jgi:uncharacterized membrane protein YqiK
MSAKNEFPFPKLLAFLESEADQVEFMKVAAEIGLCASDQEIGKLLLALQLYKAYYAEIPRQIKAVHRAALEEMQQLRDEVRHLAERVGAESNRVGDWAESIQQNIQAVQPETMAEALHKRLLEEAMAAVSGSAQALVSAYARIDKATSILNAAASQAEASIQQWQIVTLHRVWMSAFFFCATLNGIASACAWFFFIKH